MIIKIFDKSEMQRLKTAFTTEMKKKKKKSKNQKQNDYLAQPVVSIN